MNALVKYLRRKGPVSWATLEHALYMQGHDVIDVSMMWQRAEKNGLVMQTEEDNNGESNYVYIGPNG